jgi:hypothetical protein
VVALATVPVVTVLPVDAVVKPLKLVETVDSVVPLCAVVVEILE